MSVKYLATKPTTTITTSTDNDRSPFVNSLFYYHESIEYHHTLRDYSGDDTDDRQVSCVTCADVEYQIGIPYVINWINISILTR